MSVAHRSVCLFCSAVEDLPPAARELAAEFGTACAGRGLRLVYGGSGRGLMGIAARAAAAAGGEVLGFMPRHLVRPERAAEEIGTLVIVDSLAERKHKMAEAADLFVALPGGIGTLNELIEMLTLNDLRLQDKPVILCASDGFWQPFVEMIERFRSYGVLRPSIERSLRVTSSVGEAMSAIENWLSPARREEAAASRGV
ncbi:MAG: TIGR00730 family Rossman fold protein [Burkholderiales bacterium]